MQVHEAVSRVGDVLTLNILNGHAGGRLMRLLLTQGIEIEIGEIRAGSVKLLIRAPGEMLVVEELAWAV
ncbi:carbon storage regulator [Pseudomonas sp. AOB-7]|uniref:carbon storage regulator n=1 Tax=Pseudomonas sp. AOB-7 TaxID=2482750 RepID=UPI0011C38ED0|nr:carbon storage regulator [Pseudomonas sp. AOB-7]